ncbi:MAG: TIGR04211 family SH3 domain-containing protein [Pseudomonadota bacterium]
MRSPRTAVLALLALYTPVLLAQKQQYIDDEISVTLRDAPSNDAAFLGAVKSGDRVTVLESLGPQSFARIRTADGKEGWITARFLTDEPAAIDALNSVRRELDQAKSRIRSLEADLEKAQAELQQARPALDLAQENDQLRMQISELQRGAQEVERRFNEQKAWRRTMLTGGALVGAGVFLGLLLPWIGRTSRRRRRGDF